MIPECIDSLYRSGYALHADDNNIRCEYHGTDNDVDYINGLLEELRSNKTQALEFLRKNPQYAYADITKTVNELPFKSKKDCSVISGDKLLDMLSNKLRKKNIDLRIIDIFRQRLNSKQRLNIEYPIMIRNDNNVFALKKYETIIRYAASGSVKFRYYTQFDLLTMIFR